MGNVCYCCGADVGAENLAWDYTWPDVLADMPADERETLVRHSSRVFVVAEGYGVATRVILPIKLDNDRTATLGVWVNLAGGGEQAWQIDQAVTQGGDAWIGYRITGELLNAVEPWPEVYFTEVTAVGVADGKIARVVDGTDPTLRRVLTETWPHQEFLRTRR